MKRINKYKVMWVWSMKRKWKKQNSEISHIYRITLDPTIYIESENLFLYQCVDHRMLKVTWARLSVWMVWTFRMFSALWDLSDGCVARWFATHGLVRARFGWARDLEVLHTLFGLMPGLVGTLARMDASTDWLRCMLLRRFARACATGAGPLGPWTGEDLQSYRKDEDVDVGIKEIML